MNTENTLNDLIKKISQESHGVQTLKELNYFLKRKYKKTQQALTDFLEKEFLRKPIRWEQAKDTIWTSEKKKESNEFKFIQGDIICTSRVLRLGTSEYNQEHDLWIVRSPTCDCVRADYVRVSPVIEVTEVSQEPQNSDYMNFKTALFFSTSNRFPLPKSLLEDDKPRKGFYCDFLEPFFLKKEDKDDAVVLKSLLTNGWHLFNATLLNLESRANLDEELKLRSQDL